MYYYKFIVRMLWLIFLMYMYWYFQLVVFLQYRYYSVYLVCYNSLRYVDSGLLINNVVKNDSKLSFIVNQILYIWVVSLLILFFLFLLNVLCFYLVDDEKV